MSCAWDGDSVMRCSGGKHGAARRQVMGSSREERQMVRLRHPWPCSAYPRQLPGPVPTLPEQWGEHVLAHAPCPFLWLFEMCTLPGGTEKLLDVRVRGLHPYPPPPPQHCHVSHLCLMLLPECCRQGAAGRQVTFCCWEGFSLGQGKKIANGPCCSSASKHFCPNTSQTLLSSEHNLSPEALPVPLHLWQPTSRRGHGDSTALITVSICSSFGPGVLQQQTLRRTSRARRSEPKAQDHPANKHREFNLLVFHCSSNHSTGTAACSRHMDCDMQSPASHQGCQER